MSLFPRIYRSVLLVLCSLPCFAQVYSTSDFDKKYEMVLKNPSVEIESTEAINLLYNYKFIEADKEIRWLKYRFPHHPMPHFLLALAEWWKIVPNTKVTTYDNKMIMHLDSAITLGEKLYDSQENKIEPAFFLAASYAFKGRIHSERKNWTKATFAGKNALKYFEKCKENGDLSPELLFGDGIYNYYAQWIPKEYPLLKPILAFFPKGNKELGMQQLEQVATNAFYTRVEARYFLLQIYSMENQYDKAYEMAKYMWNTYPDNAYFERYFCRTAFVVGRIDDAEKSAKSILEKIDRGQVGYEGVSGRNAAYILGYYNLNYFRNYEASKAYYNRAITFAEQTGDTKAGYHLSSLIGLAKVAEKEKDVELALTYYKRVMEDGSKKAGQHEEAKKAVERLKKEKRALRKANRK